jgi:putative phage-type endonuclease
MDKFMGSPQWLEERRKGIGASDCAAVLGLSPWRSPYQVYLEKRGEVKDWNGNAQAEWGLLMEPVLRQFYSDATGRAVRLPDKILYAKERPYMLASLDGFTDDERIVEIKTARSSKGWGEPGTSEVPDHYAIQVHHQMIVTGFEVADVVVSIGGGSPEIYEVPADKEIQEMIIEACAKFWEKVVAGNPPEPTTYADAVQRFGKIKAEGAVSATHGDFLNYAEIKEIREQISKLEAREELLKGKLILSLGEAGDLLIHDDGTPLISYKLANGRKSFDAKTLEKEMPEIYQQYLKQGEPSRRFLLK